MIKVIKGAKVYSPEALGKKDVVIANNKIEGIYDKVNIPKDFIEIEEIDGEGMLLFPGFIDSHVHITGGGGEGGFKTRTPELPLSELVRAGITSVVGCIGTDGVCRNMRSLIAKAKALEEEGISTYCYTGSYEVPVKFMTDSIKGDLMLVDKIIGVGEIAISDHRSSQPTFQEFVNLVAQSRVGGLLSGKAGIVNVHLGGGARRLDYLFKLVEETEIPPTQLLPTHINRTENLFNMGADYTKIGGFIDLTTSSNPNHLEKGEVRAGEGLKKLLDMNVDVEHVTFSSDGNGSMPLFNDEGKLVGLGICSVDTLYREVREAILNYNVPIEKAIKVITSNVASLLKLTEKGRVEKGFDADFVLVNENDLKINKVIAKGRLIADNGESLVKGTFEK